MSRLSGREPRVATGVDISYSGPTEDPRLDGPERFLHFDVREQDAPLPPGVRRARLGGKSGLFAPARSRDYSSETYFANHARFFWTERGVKYAATLHNFGPRTARLLAALVADLRPASRLRPAGPRSVAPAVTTIPAVSGPVSVAIGSGAVWVAGQGQVLGDELAAAALVRIDPRSRRTAGSPIAISSFLGASAVAVAGTGAVWVAHRDLHKRSALRRLDPATSRLVRPVAAGPELVAVAVARGFVWAVDYGGWPGDRKYRGGAVLRVDARTGRIVSRIAVGRAPAAIAVGSGGVWVTNNLDGTVTRIDPRTNRVARRIRVGDEPVGIAVGQGAVWVASHADHTVRRIDPGTNKVVKRIVVGRGPRGITVGGGAVWVTNEFDDTVSRIDPATNRVVKTIPVGAGPAGNAYGERAVWVANNLDGTVTRIEADAGP